MSNLFFAILFLITGNSLAALPTSLPPGDYTIQKKPYNMPIPKDQKREIREEDLVKAKVWRVPTTPIERVNFALGEPANDGFAPTDEIFCKWAYSVKMNGMTPKFQCTLAGGDTIKIKYSKNPGTNPEVPGEIMGSRLLRALGFGADRMYAVKKVRCFGCPADPFLYTSQLHSPFAQVRNSFFRIFGSQDQQGEFFYEPNFKTYSDFEYVAIERHHEGHRIEASEDQGWDLNELKKISETMGGASTVEVEALQIMLAFIQHADNKPANQVLICLDSPLRPDGRCDQPVAAINDLGGTFGSGYKMSYSKVNVVDWSETPIWKDTKGSCALHLNSSPVGTALEAQVSEGARLKVADLLSRLSDTQIRDIVNYAGLSKFKVGGRPNRFVENWVRVFAAKRDEIRNRKPCN